MYGKLILAPPAATPTDQELTLTEGLRRAQEFLTSEGITTASVGQDPENQGIVLTVWGTGARDALLNLSVRLAKKLGEGWSHHSPVWHK